MLLPSCRGLYWSALNRRGSVHIWLATGVIREFTRLEQGETYHVERFRIVHPARLNVSMHDVWKRSPV